MIAGATVKTRPGIDSSKQEYYPMYTRDGNKITQIGKVAENTIVGTFVRTETVNLTEYCVFKNTNPVVSGGTTYVFGVIENRYVSQSGSMTPYYCTATQLNIRSTPSSALSSNIIGKANKSQLVGTGDGTEKNGFLQLQLTGGGTGWVSKAYLTTKSPVTGAKPVPSESTPDALPDPADNADLLQTQVENKVGDQWVPYVKWGAIGIIALIVVLSLVRVLKHK